MALAEVRHGVAGGALWRGFWNLLGLCLVRGTGNVSTLLVKASFGCGDCDGKQEGWSQHKRVSSRSWDSGV